ncbi:hypothetical protein XaC1_139 [Xanthomonas phage XaC1]|nr:hypothetical protein XaC1_139 [Xanthomonas phage XaC1]
MSALYAILLILVWVYADKSGREPLLWLIGAFIFTPVGALILITLFNLFEV